jgi:hypothetical protein
MSENPNEHAPVPAAENAPQDEESKGGKKKSKKEKKKLGSSRGVETMFRTSYRVHMDLSSLADTKANIMISINGLIISITIASISPKIDANPWLLIPTSILLLACLASMVSAILAARPRVNSSIIDLESFKRKKGNLLFFGHYTSLEEDDFVDGMTDLMENQEAIYYNMIRDIYGIGSVLETKFRLLQRAYTTFMWGLTMGILGFIAVYIWVVLVYEVETFPIG